MYDHHNTHKHHTSYRYPSDMLSRAAHVVDVVSLKPSMRRVTYPTRFRRLRSPTIYMTLLDRHNTTCIVILHSANLLTDLLQINAPNAYDVAQHFLDRFYVEGSNTWKSYVPLCFLAFQETHAEKYHTDFEAHVYPIMKQALQCFLKTDFFMNDERRVSGVNTFIHQVTKMQKPNCHCK